MGRRLDATANRWLIARDMGSPPFCVVCVAHVFNFMRYAFCFVLVFATLVRIIIQLPVYQKHWFVTIIVELFLSKIFILFWSHPSCICFSFVKKLYGRRIWGFYFCLQIFNNNKMEIQVHLWCFFPAILKTPFFRWNSIHPILLYFNF